MRSYTYLASVPMLAALLAAPVAEPVRADGHTPAATERVDRHSHDYVARQIDNLNRLVNTSSGAKRVGESGNAKAVELREHARSLLRQGQAAFERGEMEGALTLLDRASATMFEAIRTAGSGGVISDKKRNDFAARAESVKVLTEALNRIAAEKGSSDSAAKVTATVEETVAKARQLLEKGRLDEARRVLDGAYELAKASVEELRGGDTLVRSLNFASKEEEYHYEVDRNETHKMLVEVLLQEKRAAGTLSSMVDDFLSQAQTLREQADKQAADGDYATAVSTLEQSTKQLQRAIRMGGVYIPG